MSMIDKLDDHIPEIEKINEEDASEVEDILPNDKPKRLMKWSLHMGDSWFEIDGADFHYTPDKLIILDENDRKIASLVRKDLTRISRS